MTKEKPQTLEHSLDKGAARREKFWRRHPRAAAVVGGLAVFGAAYISSQFESEPRSHADHEPLTQVESNTSTTALAELVASRESDPNVAGQAAIAELNNLLDPKNNEIPENYDELARASINVLRRNGVEHLSPSGDIEWRRGTTAKDGTTVLDLISGSLEDSAGQEHEGVFIQVDGDQITGASLLDHRWDYLEDQVNWE